MLQVPKHGLRGRGLDSCAVGKAGVPVAAALRSEVHEMPHGSEQVNASFFDFGRHPRMRRVEVAQRPPSVAGENGNGGVLMALAVFAT